MTAIILCVSSSSAQRGDVHNKKHTSPELRQLQEYVLDPGPPPTCSFGMNTLQVDGFSQGDGILFAMKSEETDDNGVKITSLGFHVPSAATQNVDFQVYALKKEGYYADPTRDELNQGEGYDYRGNSQIDEWEMISSGTIRKSDLAASDTNNNAPDFYKIPFDMFSATLIPPNGGVRSFLIRTTLPTLLYANPVLENEVNGEQLLVGFNDPSSPNLLVGEFSIGFPDTKIKYRAREFVGKIFYETECATEAPSVSNSPTTSVPTSSPSLSPTSSYLPTETSMPPTQPAGAEAAISFPLLKCDPNQETVPQEVQDAVSDQVTYTVGKDAEDFSNFESAVLEAEVICGQRRLTGGEHNRLLPTQSSAMQFSVVITGDYRSLDGKPPDLGPIVEDSINADAAKFTKELKARSNNPLLEQAQEPEVKARTLDNDELEKFKNDDFEVTIRAIPSPSPTEPPQDNMKTALLIVILIVSGVMVVLASFLLFRHAERRAVDNRRRKMEMKYISDQRESTSKEETLKQEWEKENSMRMASNSWQKMKNENDYPYYGGPPPQPQHQLYPHARDHYQGSYEED